MEKTGTIRLGDENFDFPIIEVRGEAIPEICADAAILRSSDAHQPDIIGERVTHITVEALTIAELRKAAAGVGGRSIVGEIDP